MSNATLETIKIEAVGKFGVLVNGAWLKVAEPLTLSSFTKGAEYKVGITTDAKGKRTIATMEGGAPALAKAVAENPAPAKPPFKKPFFSKPAAPSNGLSKEEWAMKDVRISRQGLYQAALQSPLIQTAASLDEALKMAEAMAEAGLRFVNK